MSGHFQVELTKYPIKTVRKIRTEQNNTRKKNTIKKQGKGKPL